jgi:hypothetical protein
MNPPGEPGCRNRTRNRTVASESPRQLGAFFIQTVLISIYYENPLRLRKEYDLSFLDFSSQDGMRVSQNQHQYETCAPEPINAPTARQTLGKTRQDRPSPKIRFSMPR